MAKKTANSSLRTVDHAARAAKGAENRYEQDLIDALSGGTNTMVRYVDTPPGSGSPAGMHVHVFDQLFYIISGTMSIEIDGDRFEAMFKEQLAGGVGDQLARLRLLALAQAAWLHRVSVPG